MCSFSTQCHFDLSSFVNRYHTELFNAETRISQLERLDIEHVQRLEASKIENQSLQETLAILTPNGGVRPVSHPGSPERLSLLDAEDVNLSRNSSGSGDDQHPQIDDRVSLRTALMIPLHEDDADLAREAEKDTMRSQNVDVDLEAEEDNLLTRNADADLEAEGGDVKSQRVEGALHSDMGEQQFDSEVIAPDAEDAPQQSQNVDISPEAEGVNQQSQNADVTVDGEDAAHIQNADVAPDAEEDAARTQNADAEEKDAQARIEDLSRQLENLRLEMRHQEIAERTKVLMVRRGVALCCFACQQGRLQVVMRVLIPHEWELRGQALSVCTALSMEVLARRLVRTAGRPIVRRCVASRVTGPLVKCVPFDVLPLPWTEMLQRT